jgi:YNFM family putative membrane transporter
MQTQPIKPVILQILVFALVSAGFTTIYLVQPVLPIIQLEFGVTEKQASYTVSSVILGIALANLPFGRMSDIYPIKPIIAAGGFVVASFGFLCAASHDLSFLIVFRFIQGIFIPALTTCLAAYLSRNLPRDRLNVIMGSYVSATVAGGLGGRLIGGWIHSPSHWRHAFITASVLVAAASIASLLWLPAGRMDTNRDVDSPGFISLIQRMDLLRIFSVAFCAFFVFSAVFNYLPFYLSGPPFNASTGVITLMYMAYVIGIIIGPVSGSISNRLGNGVTMILGTIVLSLSLASTHIHSLFAVGLSLAGVCGGFFAIHAAAAGSMNRRLSASQGRANSLYILFYYLGGSAGITVGGQCYQSFGWIGVTVMGLVMLIIPLAVGITEYIIKKDK